MYHTSTFQVTFEKFPKPDRGFEVDYACFSLGSRQEATLRIGWVPQCSRPLREAMVVSYTSKAGTHKTQVQLNATVKAPPQVNVIYCRRTSSFVTSLMENVL